MTAKLRQEARQDLARRREGGKEGKNIQYLREFKETGMATAGRE